MANPTTGPTNRQCNVTLSPHAITSPRPSVSQSTLADIFKRRREVKQADKAVKALKDALIERERSVITAIESGAIVVLGILTAEVHHEERRNVRWREVATEYLSPEFCQLVIDETEPTVYPRLVIA